jgi:hypothetical protein
MADSSVLASALRLLYQARDQVAREQAARQFST